MPISAVVPLKAQATDNEPSLNFTFKAAGSYDLVNLGPQGLKRPAKRITALAADTWVVEDAFGVSSTAAVPANFELRAAVRGITCGAAIAVCW